ncbi:MAG: tail fiber protein, partial [Terracidiphilus sp.]
MSDQYVGEIRIVGFNFAPVGWAQCNGQLLPISQNAALFSLLGTQFGGNGSSTFGLPNLQGCAPVDQGQGTGLTPRTMGETGGETTVTLLTTQIPSHTHVAQNGAGSDAGAPGPTTIFGGGGRGKDPA